jgi:hypothetical protein
LARARLLKPGFFTNELLAELPFEGRLLFAGLWTLADKEGRLEDRPRRIKASLFPWDEVDVQALLVALESKGFIDRYMSGGMPLIQVAKFAEHQTPHQREAESIFPGPLDEPSKGRAQPSPGSPVTGNGSSSVSIAVPVICTPSVLTYPTAGRPANWELTEDKIADWQVLYPSLDIRAECRNAYAWLLANMGRKKTAKAMPSFLVGWFIRSNDRRGGPDRRQETRAESPERRAYDEWRAGGGCHHEPRCGNFTTCQAVSSRKAS